MPSIYLSPSTQDRNIGVDGVSEKDRMRALAVSLAQLLRAQGYRVYLSLPGYTLGKAIRDSLAKLLPRLGDVHIALHSNAAPKPGTGTGTEAWVYPRGGQGDRLGQAMLRAIVPVLTLPLRPARDGGLCKVAGLDGMRLAEVCRMRAPAVLLELFFHDNPRDLRTFAVKRPRLLTAMVAGVNQYYGRH